MDYHTILCWLYTFAERALSNSAFGALLGALVGGLFTMWATKISYRRSENAADKAREFEHQKAVNDRRLIVFNTSQLILVEVSTAWSVFSEEYAAELLTLEERTPYIELFPIGKDPFPIFDSAPECLAELPTETSRQIIRFYMRAKGMITTIEMNNANTERAREYGRTQVEPLYTKLVGQGLNEQEIGTRLQEHYESETMRMGRLIGMGETADAMKLLTAEIDTLITDLKSRLEALPGRESNS